MLNVLVDHVNLYSRPIYSLVYIYILSFNRELYIYTSSENKSFIPSLMTQCLSSHSFLKCVKRPLS